MTHYDSQNILTLRNSIVLAFKDEYFKGSKQDKSRVTRLITTSCSGEEYPFLVMGRVAIQDDHLY